MDMSLWDRCRGTSPDLTQYKCWGGLDLAPVCDLSTFALLFDVDGVNHVQPYFWSPAADIMKVCSSDWCDVACKLVENSETLTKNENSNSMQID